MNLQDAKHAALLHQLTKTEGQVQDLEREYVLGLLGQTPAQAEKKATQDLWVEYWKGQGIGPAHYNDMAMQWLAAQPGNTLNEKWLSYWKSLLP